MREIVTPTCRIVVDHQDLNAGTQETIRQVRPDKSGPTGNQNFHETTSASIRCLKDDARSWKVCCQSSKQSSPHILRPYFDSRPKPAITFRLSTRSRPVAFDEDKRSRTKSWTIPF